MGVRTRDFVTLGSKRFRAVSEQRTRRESKTARIFFFHFVFLALVPFFARPKPKLPRSFFTLKTTQASELLARWSSVFPRKDELFVVQSTYE